MYTILWPYGAPSIPEAVAMLGVGGVNALLTAGAVYLARRYHVTYKRL